MAKSKADLQERMLLAAKIMGIEDVFLKHCASSSAYTVHFFHCGKWMAHEIPAQASFRWTAEQLQWWFEVACTVARESHYFQGIWDNSNELHEEIKKKGKWDSFTEYVKGKAEAAGFPLVECAQYKPWHYRNVPRIELDFYLEMMKDDVRDELQRMTLEGQKLLAEMDPPPGFVRADDHATHIAAANKEMQRLAGRDAYAVIEPVHIPTCICGAQITNETHADYCPCSSG